MKPDDYLYGRKGPWPQPCPDHPYDESPGVIHIPWSEWFDWWLHIGLRFIIQWPLFTIIYFFHGLFRPGLKEVSDSEFHELMTNSMMARFITPKMDELDKKIFHSQLNNIDQFFVIDLDPVRVISPYEGMHVSPTKTLLKKISENKFEILSVWVERTNSLFTPKDGDAWKLAKYFALQGGALCATMVVHPLQHFPMDSINAITKTALPKEHTLFKLLYPHLRFTLPLENAVLNFKMSLLHNDHWWKTYAPFPGPYDGVRDLLVEGYRGIKNNDSYPPFSYPRKPPQIYSGYGTLLNAYYETIYRYVDEVVSTIPYHDICVKQWADYIHQWIPGFPNGEEIFKDKTLTEVVAYFIWDVTIGHTIDHHNYGQMDVRQVPLRIRQAPPCKETKMWSLRKLQSPIDIMKYKLAMRLFFRPTVLTKLIDAEYAFLDTDLKESVKRFKIELKMTDARLKADGLSYISVDQIAASIQF